MKSWAEIKKKAGDKWWEIKYDIKCGFEKTVHWAEDNKELALAMIPVVLYAGKEVSKAISSIDRKIDLKKEQELQELSVYDHSLGMYHKLRRPMTPEEKIELSIRVKNGESKVEVLKDMRLLG